MCSVNINGSPEKNKITYKAESKHDNNNTTANRKLYLLNCSHIFHATCLCNFESFQSPDGVLVCPLCRSSNYSKKIFVP